MGAGRKPVVYVTAGGTTYAPGEEIPADVAKTIDNPKVWGDSSDQTDAAVVPYSKRSKGALEAEVEARNDARGDDDEPQIEVAAPGNKPELVAALEADDAAQAGN